MLPLPLSNVLILSTVLQKVENTHRSQTMDYLFEQRNEYKRPLSYEVRQIIIETQCSLRGCSVALTVCLAVEGFLAVGPLAMSDC